jgi:hypothetical protein
LQVTPGAGKQDPVAVHPADSAKPQRSPVAQSASVVHGPEPLPASLAPELLVDPELLLDDPELPSELLPLDELPELLPEPLPLPEPEPLPLDDDVTPFTPASPSPLFEPELPQPAERPTKATSMVSVPNVAPNLSLMTSS